MNVLFVIEELNESSVVAQPWKHVIEVAKRLEALGNTTQILTGESQGSEQKEKIDGVPILRIKKGRFLFNSKELLDSLNGNGVDIINWFGGPLSSMYFWRFCDSLQNRIVWSVYKGPLSFREITRLSFAEVLSLYKFWTNLLYRVVPGFFVKKGAQTSQVKRIVVWSKRLKTYFHNLGIESQKIAVVKSGVDVEVFNPRRIIVDNQHKAELGFDEDDQIVLYFGPLTSFRGVDTLISAMPAINRQVPSAKLLFLARESGKVAESTLAKKSGKWKSIRFLPGIQTREKLVEYLALADVVALPFKFWPHIECPLTILESMAMEKPVITTYTGAIPEIMQNGETGILTPPGNPHRLSEAVAKLLLDRDLSTRIGENARSYVEKLHSWNRVTQDTYGIFVDAIMH